MKVIVIQDISAEIHTFAPAGRTIATVYLIALSVKKKWLVIVGDVPKVASVQRLSGVLKF